MVRQVLRYANLSLEIKQAISLLDQTTADIDDEKYTSSSADGTFATLHVKQVVNIVDPTVKGRTRSMRNLGTIHCLSSDRSDLLIQFVLSKRRRPADRSNS